MKRDEFLVNCGMTCLAGLAAIMLPGCSSTKMLNATINGDDLIVPLTSFDVRNDGHQYFKKYIVVGHSHLKHPICIYRISDDKFTALWMQCTHQGAALQVFGEKLQCPAHGSEFDKIGTVSSGPAARNLRSFPVRINGDQLHISLKAA
jgi:Rieske Fe-S protein